MKLKLILLITLAVLLIGSIVVYFKFFWAFAEGYKEGQLNNIMYKGYIFKTYEGKLIQAGYKGGTGVQSNEFEFSATEKVGKMLEQLEDVSSKNIKLHYKEYKNAVPWRGFQEFVVDSVIILKSVPATQTESPEIPF